MKFSEKLQFLRKESKLSQEQLANMLDVSRQAVSKWESGQTYPEMDKLIELSKIFKCSLDDLTNDEIKTINSFKSKNYINTIIDEVLEIINRSVEVFKKIEFKEIIKYSLIFIFILIILSLILKVPFHYLNNMGFDLFNRFGKFGDILYGIWNFIMDLSYFIIMLFIMIYLYKERFLEKFSKNETFKEEKENKKDKKEEIKEEKNSEEKPYIKKNHNYAIFDFLASVIIFFIKFIVFFVGISFITVQFTLFLMLAILIYLIINGVISLGLLIGLTFSIILCSLFIELIFNFIFNRKENLKRVFIIFIISVSGLGLASGILAIEVSKYSYINKAPSENYITYTKEAEFNKDLMIEFNYNNVEYKFTEDETLKNKILIKYSFYDKFTNLEIYNQYNKIFISKDDKNYFNKKDLKNIFKDLSNKKIYNYFNLYDAKVEIISSKNNLEKLRKNNDEYYEKQNSNLEEIEEYQNQINYLEQRIEELQVNNDELRNKIEEYQNKINELLNI